MTRTASIFALLVTIFWGSNAAAIEAPLGMTWGASVEEVRALGVELKDNSGSEFGVGYLATSMPKALSDQQGALLSFGHDNKLWRILIISRAFENDPYGGNVKDRYQQLQAVLAEKYGKPNVTHSLGTSIYKDPQYFLAGIRGGQSSWFSNFDNPSLFVQLSIGATTSDSGVWRLIYEHKDGRRSFDASKRQREKGAL